MSAPRRSRRDRAWCSPTWPARRAGPAHAAELSQQSPVGEALVRGLVRAQLGARPAARRWWWRSGSAGCRCCSRSRPRSAAVTAVRRRPAVAAARRAAYPFLFVVGWAYVRLAERNEQEFTDADRAAGAVSTRTSCPAIVAVTLVTVGIGAYGLRFARTTSDFLVASRAVSPTWNAAAISGEYLSAASLPRRRRAGPQVRRRRALVPGRVRRRLPGAAAVRGRAAAPLRRVHPARLLRGAAAARPRCAGWPPCS